VELVALSKLQDLDPFAVDSVYPALGRNDEEIQCLSVEPWPDPICSGPQYFALVRIIGFSELCTESTGRVVLRMGRISFATLAAALSALVA